jgi:hypothetical protein
MEDVSEITDARLRNITLFVEWMIKTGLSPLDFELVEEKRPDGITLWYFQRRIKNEEIQTFDKTES